MNQYQGIVCTDRRSDGISKRPDDPNTLAQQYATTYDSLRYHHKIRSITRGRRDSKYYIDDETRREKDHMISPNPLKSITAYIMQYAVGDMDLKKVTYKMLNLIDVSISSFCNILNSPDWFDIVHQENKLAVGIADIDYDILGVKDYRNNKT